MWEFPESLHEAVKSVTLQPSAAVMKKIAVSPPAAWRGSTILRSGPIA